MDEAAAGSAAGGIRGAIEHRRALGSAGSYKAKLEQQRDEAEREVPGWVAWWVHRFADGLLWCARPMECDDPASTVYGHTCDELKQAMRDAARGDEDR